MHENTPFLFVVKIRRSVVPVVSCTNRLHVACYWLFWWLRVVMLLIKATNFLLGFVVLACSYIYISDINNILLDKVRKGAL
jgi:hypothetical protein